MRLGLSTFTYHYAITQPPTPAVAVGPLDMVAKASEAGVGVLQFGDNLPLDRLSAGELAELKRAADQASVSLEVGMRGFEVELIGRYIDLAVELGSPILRVVTDTPGHEPSAEEIVAALRDLAPELEAAAVVLGIENHDRFGAARLREMIEAVHSPAVGVCLDTVNSLVALEDPHTVVEALADVTVNLHIKDVRARRDPTGLGVLIQGVPAGQGQVAIPWVVGKVRSVAPRANAILEQWTPPADDPRATIEREAAWAREGIAYLRSLIPD